jgi:hypothetical protein
MEREKKPRKDREINPEKRKRMRNEKKNNKRKNNIASCSSWYVASLI